MPAADADIVWGVGGFFVVLALFTAWALVSGKVWRGLPAVIYDRRDAPIIYWIILAVRLLLLAVTGFALMAALGVIKP